MPTAHEFVLTLACRDTPGIVHAVSGLPYQAGCNIVDPQQFGALEGDDATGLFFMRVHFRAPPRLGVANARGSMGHGGASRGVPGRWDARFGNGREALRR